MQSVTQLTCSAFMEFSLLPTTLLIYARRQIVESIEA
jgi:hypothetical protein